MSGVPEEESQADLVQPATVQRRTSGQTPRPHVFFKNARVMTSIKADRKRVFLLASTAGFQFPDSLFFGACRLEILMQLVLVFFVFVRFYFELCSEQEMFKNSIDVTGMCNPGNSLPIHLWLTSTESEADQQRLRTMGNIVVPLQACKALAILSEARVKLDAT